MPPESVRISDARAHQVDERHVVERIQQQDIGLAAQQTVYRLPHVRIAMHRVGDLYVAPPRQAEQRGADVFEAIAEALAPVRGDHNQLLRGDRVESTAPRATPPMPARRARRAPHRCPELPVTKMRSPATPSAASRLGGQRGGGEVQGGEARGHHPVHLFRKRLRQIAGAQSGLDVSHGNVLVEGRQRARQRGGGIALHQDHVGPFGRQDGLQLREDARGGLRQRLSRLHHVQVVIRRHLERRQHLVQHAAMLRRHAGLHRKLAGPLPHVQQHRAEFDRFRARAEDEKHICMGHHTK